MTSSKLRGYTSYGALYKFSKKKKNPRLQGFGGYAGCTGLLLKIFNDILKVTRLQKLRCSLHIFKKNKSKVARFWRLRRLHRASADNFQ